MISAIMLFLARKEYLKDCERYGENNLAIPWIERIGAFFACGFWGIDLVAIIALIEMIFVK